MTSDTDWMLVFVVKLSLVSAGLWCIHRCLGNANPRLRVWLWRIGSVGMAVVALSSWCEPVLRLPVANAPWVVREQVPAKPEAAMGHEMELLAIDSIDPRRKHGNAESSKTLLPESNVTLPGDAHTDQVSKDRLVDAGIAVDHTAPLTLPQAKLRLAICWLVGVLLLFTRWGLGKYKLATLLRRTTVAPDWVQAMSEHVALQFGLDPVEVVTSDELSTPSVTGLRQKTILLPSSMTATENAEDIRAALTHELGHVFGGDLAWDAWIRVVAMLMWPHPLCWRMPTVHRNACERLCDAVASRQIGDESYQSSLARIALQVSGATAKASSMAMAKTPDVIARLRFLKRSVSTASLGRAGIALAVALAAFCALVLSQAMFGL